MSRVLIIVGVVCILLGLAWPWLGRIGMGQLPGDIAIERNNVSIYLPLATCLLLSAVVSFIFWLAQR